MKKLIIHITGIFALCLNLNAQVDLILPQQVILQFQADDLWVLTLNNLGRSQRIHLFAELKDAKNQLVLQARSASLQLPSGRFEIQANQLLSREQKWLVDPSKLKGGTYQICIHVMADDFSQRLGNACVFRQIQNVGPSADKENAKKGPISINGMLGLSGQASNRQGYFQEVPANYLRLQVAPTINVSGVPLQGQMFISTEQNGLRYDVNTLGVSFRREALLAQLQQKGMAYWQEQQHKLSQDLPIDTSFYNRLSSIGQSEIERLQAMMGSVPQGVDSLWQERLPDLARLERIETIMAHENFRNLDQDWSKFLKEYPWMEQLDSMQVQDSVCARIPERCEEFLQLYAKKAEWERLKAQKQRLLALKKEYEKYRLWLEKAEQLKALEAGDYRSLLSDPKVLSQLPIFSRFQEKISAFKQVGVGVTYPFYSANSIDGIILKGLDVTYHPGKWFVSLSGGKLGRTVIATQTQNPNAWLGASRLGIGDPDKNYLAAMYLHARQFAQEDTGLVAALPVSLWQNQVFGVQGQLNIWDSRVQLGGEYLQSLSLLADSSAREERSAEQLSGQTWEIRGELSPLANGQTQITARYAWVSPDYYSMGAPLLITDRERYQFRLQQSLKEGRWQLSAYWRKDADNLVPYKWTQTTVSAYGLSMRWQPKKGPMVQVDYAPYFQQNDRLDSLKYQNRLSVLTAQSQYSWQAGSWQGTSAILYSQQLNRGQSEQQDFSAYLLTVNQMLMGPGNISLIASGTLMKGQYSVERGDTYAADVSLNWGTQKWGTYALGGHWLEEKQEGGAERKGLYASVALSLAKSLQFDLRAERNYLFNYIPQQPNTNEYLIRGGLSFRW